MSYFYDPAVDNPLSQTLLRKVRVNMAIVHNSQYIYGQNTDNYRPYNPAVPATFPQVPVEIAAMQGNEYGWGQECFPYLLPRQGMLKFEIFNGTDQDIVLSAMIYGLKVKI